MRMQTLVGFAALVFFAGLGSVPARAADTTKEQLIGSWQITSFKASSGDKVSHPLGEKPAGLVGFSATRLLVMLIDSTRQPPAAAAITDPEAVALMKTHAAYTGKYDVDPTQTPDGIKITIHVDSASNQALVGTNRVLFVKVDGNKLSVRSPAIVVPTTGLTNIVQLEFVRAD